jgi:hypothetical protein
VTDPHAGRERRRAERIRAEPLRVLVHGGPEGVLLDLSEFGAKLELPTSPAPESRVTLDLIWRDVPVRLNARVVRSTASFADQSRLTWGEPTSYHVAVEFFDVSAECAMTLHDVVLSATRPTQSQP